MKIDGIAVDLLFVSLPSLEAIPQDINVLSDIYLQGLDEPSVSFIAPIFSNYGFLLTMDCSCDDCRCEV